MSEFRQVDGFDERELQQLAAVNPADIHLAAMDLLARREYSLKELRQRLLKRFKDDALVEQQLQRLREENLQSDARYAGCFLRQRIARGQGPVRIRREMRQRGIAELEINAALEAEAPDWFALAEATCERKFGVLQPQNLKEKARRVRFMQYRGFATEHFRHVLK